MEGLTPGEWIAAAGVALGSASAAGAWLVRAVVRQNVPLISEPILAELRSLAERNQAEHQELRGRVDGIAGTASENKAAIARVEGAMPFLDARRGREDDRA